MEYKIEKNVPLSEWGGKSTYPFKKMDVDDSFAFDKSELKRVRSAS